MKKDVLMPRIGVNDNYVTLCSWNVKNGEQVKKGQVVAQIETTKESCEIEAEEEGYIQQLIPAKKLVEVGTVIARICDVQEKGQKQDSEQGDFVECIISTKAQKMMDEYKIDPSVFKGRSIIKEKDVKEYLENNKTVEAPEMNDKMFENKLLINGGGCFCKVILDILSQRNEYQVVGIVDRNCANIKKVKGVDVIATNDEQKLKELYDEGYWMMINAIGFDGNKHGRREPYEMMKKVGFKVPNVIHARSIIEPSVRMGEGNLIVAGAIIGTDARIGNNCIINAGTIISHDCVIGNHCHIASGAVLAGNVVVGENTLIGQGCTVYRDIKIGKNVVISNGVHVFENVPDGAFLR